MLFMAMFMLLYHKHKATDPLVGVAREMDCENSNDGGRDNG